MTLIAFARKDGFEVFTHPHRVGDDRKAKGREAGQIAVHADDDIGDLRREPRDDMREQWHAGKLNERLVGAPHAARFAARENDATGSHQAIS
jgi:hypothetical protein